MPDQHGKPLRLHRNVWVLSITSFLTDVSSEMLFNLLPLFLVNVLGARTLVVGLIDGVAETTASLMKLYSGAMSDRLNQRKKLAVLGYGLSALAKPLLYLASTWGWVFGVRFADRIGKGIRTAPRDALLAGSVPPERRGLAFGLHRAGDTAGAFTGLGIAAFIIWLSDREAAELTRPTFQLVVLASIIPAILGVVVLALYGREISQAAPASGGSKHEAWWKFEQFDPRLRRFLIVLVLFTLGNSSDAFIILRGQERGLSLLPVMGMLMTFNAVYSVVSGPAGSLSDRLGRPRLLLAGWLFYVLVYLGFALSNAGWHVWALFGLYGLFYALTEGTAKALVADLTQPGQRGAAYGLYNAAIGLSAMPASLIAGLLWQGVGPWAGFGPAAPFVFGASMAAAAALLFMLWVRPPDRPLPDAGALLNK
jgi:MFS family permease